MKALSSIIEKYLKGESVYKPIVIILNLLLNLNIASFIYEKYSGQYYWYNIDDYKAILNFLFKGNYIVPLCIYFSVYFSIAIINSIIFSLLTTSTNIKLQEKITSFSLKSEKVSIEKKILENELVSSSIKEIITAPDWSVNLYKILKKSIPKSDLKKFEIEANMVSYEIQKLFGLIIRSLIVSSIYFYVHKDFGLGLFTFTVISLLFSEIVLIFIYFIVNIAPLAIKNLSYKMDELIQNENANT